MARKPIPISITTTVKEVGTHARQLVSINNDCAGKITLTTGEVIPGKRKRFFGVCRYYDEFDEEVKVILGFLPLEWAYDPAEETETETQEENA